MNRAEFLVTLGACLWLSAADAQLPKGEATSPKLVKLDVVAVDSHGQPVGDLTAADFQIADSGKPQQVAIFRHSDSKLQRTLPPRPGEFSNRAAANVPHATLILFDLLNDSFGASGAAAYYLEHGLQSLETADYLYLYILTKDAHLFAVRGLPGAEGEASTPAGVPWTRDSKAVIDQAVAKVFRLRPSDMDIDARVRLTYGSLETVARLLAGIPGRKNIVWITHGIPISLGPDATAAGDTIDYTPLLRRLSLTLNRVGVAMYPVQQVPPGTAMDGSPEARYSGIGSEQTLQQFADLTGGPLKSSGDIGAAVRQAMNDVRTSYLLGYYPPPENWDGKFHKLRVVCSRKGVRVRTKTGYYAWENTATGEQEALDGALKSSFDASEIGLRGTVSSPASGGRTTHFDFRIDPADVRIAQEGDRYTSHLALQLAGFAANGKVETTAVIPLNLSLSPEEHAKVLQNGIEFPQEIALDNTVEKVRFLVFDRGSYAVGSLTIPLKR